MSHMDKWYMCSALEDLAGISLFDKLGIKRREIMSDEELEAAKKSGLAKIRPIRPSSELLLIRGAMETNRPRP
jgi:hypothetical protein